tara:strand:+ start:3197 stop:4240 length:1044 start_codon:yes stop_codon:yes gene_type:complete
MNKKLKVFVTGVTGQDGSYMVDYLLNKYKDIEVYGGVRTVSVENRVNTRGFSKDPRYTQVRFDLTDSHSVDKAIEDINPDYFINLAAQSFVGDSWDIPASTFQINAVGVLNCLESIRRHCPRCKFYNAGTSEEFGDVSYSPQDEDHPLKPRSPYGASKVSARMLVKTYRESYNMFAVQMWLFNHESPRRPDKFVTQKIIKALSKGEPVRLGNIYSKRDWSHAKDMVKAIWHVMQQDEPREYVIGSGETYTIKDFCNFTLEELGIFSEGEWRGEGLDEKFCIGEEAIIEIDPAFFRPAEVELLKADPSKIKKELDWTPEYDIMRLIEDMVNSELNKNRDSKKDSKESN